MAYSNFVAFRNYVKEVVRSGDLSTFKDNDVFNGILEHKRCKWGSGFYKLIVQEFQLPDAEILEFCKRNDAIGNPELQTYSFGKCASNSIKYVYHANLVLRHMKERGLTEVDIAEIGGGYGGMAFAVVYFAPKYDIRVKSYTMIDFPEVIQLQELYLRTVLGDTSSIFQFHSTYTYGADVQLSSLYLIAVYSLGELSVSDKQRYIQDFLPKTSHGFILWNALPYMNLGKNETSSVERPLTGPNNKFVFY